MQTPDRLVAHYGKGVSEIIAVDPDPIVIETTETYVSFSSTWHENSVVTMYDDSTKLIKNIVVGDRLKTMCPVCTTTGLEYDFTLAINPNDVPAHYNPLAVNNLQRQLPPNLVYVPPSPYPIDTNYLPTTNPVCYAYSKAGFRDSADITWVAGEAIVASNGVVINIPTSVGGIYDNFFLYSIRGYYTPGPALMFNTVGIGILNSATGLFTTEASGGPHGFASRNIGFTSVASFEDALVTAVKPSAIPLPGGWAANAANFQAVGSIKKVADGGGAWLTAALGRYYGLQLKRSTVSASTSGPCFIVNGYLVF